ncbi:hypothetical protein [Candidatus Nephthysia bennettiae]|uniref:hypothetical protein n=1 Tax=Candidatus Nephthysia bennettiae TaxID=3127016 RepID=UPI0030C6A6A5
MREDELAVAEVADVDLDSGDAQLDRVRYGGKRVLLAAAAVGPTVGHNGSLEQREA